MRYRLTMSYGDPILDNITADMRQLLPDWDKERKRLLYSWSIEFETDEPLTPGQVIEIEGQFPPEIDHIELEEIE